VIDWYNNIGQHNPTPAGFKTGTGAAYESDLRDKKHGRVYRVVPDARKKKPAFTLAGATPEKLVATLKNDNMFWRRHAQRLLVEGARIDRKTERELRELVFDKGQDEIKQNAAVCHALWAAHGVGLLEKWTTHEID